MCCITFFINIYTNYNEYSEVNISKIFPYFILLAFTSTILHELGHAAATYFFNAKHGGIGFGFYIYIIPFFFADVTDVWRLSRWKRIVVNSAGVYFEIIFCFILTTIGFFTQNQTYEVLALVIFVKSLYNLLPFLRADGYWILSDLFNKPNLSYHSFNNLKISLTSLFKGTIPKFPLFQDYLIALYGLLNILLIGFFFNYQIVRNIDLITHFPSRTIEIVMSVFKRNFKMSFHELIRYLSVLIFYVIGIKILFGIIKKRLKK